MKILAGLALLAATCTKPAPSPQPIPDPIPYPIPNGGDDAGAPVTDPPTQCEVAFSVMVDAECPPATGHDVWMAKCVTFPQATIDCVMTVESCASMRNCQGFDE